MERSKKNIPNPKFGCTTCPAQVWKESWGNYEYKNDIE